MSEFGPVEDEELRQELCISWIVENQEMVELQEAAELAQITPEASPAAAITEAVSTDMAR